MTDSLSWLNGQLLESPQISAESRGFLVGFGLFETIKVDQGQPHFLERHLLRLQLGCRRMQLPDVSLAQIQSAIALVIQSNPKHQHLARLRITVTGNAEGADTLITIHSMQPWPETTTGTIVPWVRNERSPLAGVKTTSYAENVMAQRWAQGRGFTEGLFLNSVGELCEGATSNIFVVKGDEVLTPHIESGALPGIVREVLLDHDLASESILTRADLETADEVFLTSSTRGVHPVIRCGERELSAVGSATRAVQQAFEKINPVSE